MGEEGDATLLARISHKRGEAGVLSSRLLVVGGPLPPEETDDVASTPCDQGKVQNQRMPTQG